MVRRDRLLQRGGVQLTGLVRLGGWSGKPASFKAPAADEDGLSTAVIVQGAKGGRIIGAAVKE